HSERAGDYPPGFADAVREQLAVVEKAQGKRFGDPADPLLVSVRSGARESMPGMMDPILNLGLNDETVHGLASTTGDARFAHDCYRRFIHMYAGIVLGVGPESESAPDPFEEMLEGMKRDAGVDEDAGLDAQLLAT
ncbi:MAG: pyruvate, phosphate dikinase, partial [Gammaproteobacteria bacterium]|nr:pyruvate, phosphate dikinase [Gammaproteobacteria bacterium]